MLAKQELERFAHDVGSVRVDEFGVPVQVVSDFIPQTDLKTSAVPVAIGHSMIHLVMEDGREVWASAGHQPKR